jgi:hypothetical protein
MRKYRDRLDPIGACLRRFTAMGDVDDFAMLQQLIEEEEEEEEEEDLEVQAAAGGALIIYGAEEACCLRAEHRWNRRRYLTRPDLLRNPRVLTPWQTLYQSRNNRAFITTMGFDVATLNSILVAGFEMRWNTNPIPRNDVPSSAGEVVWSHRQEKM